MKRLVTFSIDIARNARLHPSVYHPYAFAIFQISGLICLTKSHLTARQPYRYSRSYSSCITSVPKHVSSANVHAPSQSPPPDLSVIAAKHNMQRTFPTVPRISPSAFVDCVKAPRMHLCAPSDPPILEPHSMVSMSISGVRLLDRAAISVKIWEGWYEEGGVRNLTLSFCRSLVSRI